MSGGAIEDPVTRLASIGRQPSASGLHGEHVVCVSSIDWASTWQTHQELMSRLAEQGNHILFVENTGVRSPRLRDLPRLRQRLRNRFTHSRGFRVEQQGVVVYSPLAVPLPHSPAAHLANRALVVRPIRHWLRKAGWPRPIVWTFLPTVLARDLIRGVDAMLTVYCCVDDLPASSSGARKLVASETEILRSSDLVFVTAVGLHRRAVRVREDVHLFPAGVDYPLFERVRLAEHACPSDLRDMPSPRAGFVGSVNSRIDQELLCEVARQLPTVSFVLVGPVESDVSALSACPNVRLLGPRPHGELPRYMKAFDAGIIPYRLTPFTAQIYPAKLNEYLAMGLPVVSTELPEIHRFNANHGALVLTAGHALGFVEALGSAFADRSPLRAANRQSVAAANDWSIRLDGMSALISRALAWRRSRNA